MLIKDRTVLITGGRRVGRQLASMLAERGAHVAMTYHSHPDPINKMVDTLQANGHRALGIQSDLRDPSQVESALDNTYQTFGRIDILVNMVSRFDRTPFTDLSPSIVNDTLDVNLKAPMWTAIATAQRMQKQTVENGVKGKIIHFLDWAVYRPYRDYLPYLVAKGGLDTLTKTLATELAPDILVNGIAPAMIAPPESLSEEEIESICQQTPLRRHGTAEDANNLVLYLIEGTDFATGSIFRIDGGRFLE